MNAGQPIPTMILGVPFGGTTGQVLVGVTGAAPAWSDTFATAKTIDLGSGALPASITNPHVRLASADGGASFLELEVFGASNSGIISRKARGTRASKTAVNNNDILGQFQARGYGTTGYGTAEAASIKLLTAEAFTDTAQGGRISFSTITIGSTTLLDRMYVDSNGIGVAVMATAGNGLLQLASGTTKANGWACGTDVFGYRNGANAFKIECSAGFTVTGKLSANGAAASSTLTGNTVAQVITWLQSVFQ